MPFALQSASSRLSLPAAFATALVPLALVDAVLFFGRLGASQSAFWLTLYLLGQRVFLASLAVLTAMAAARLPSRAVRYASVPLVFALAYATLTYLYREDLVGQIPSRRRLIVAVTAMVPTAVVIARLFLPWHPLLRVPLFVCGVALGIGNHLLLKLNYPGFHVACVAFSTLACGVALLPRPATAFPRRRGVVAAFLALSALGDAAVLLPPHPRASSVLLTEDALSLYRFAAQLHKAGPVKGAREVGNPYFEPRSKAPPIDAGPPLLDRERLVVVLITVDALRYDAVSGPRAERLPTFSALAREGTTFTNAITPAVSTTGTVVSLFSGLYHPQMRWRQDNSRRGRNAQIPDTPHKRFPELLSRAKVDTFIAPTQWRLTKPYKASVGFRTEYQPRNKGNKNAEDVLPPLGKWVLGRGDDRAFAYVHLLDAHGPYDRAGTEGTPFERYLREVELVDREIGKLIDALKRGGVWDRTVMIVSADHGEAFGEHGQSGHNGWLYQELSHVPLIVRVPGAQARSVDEPVSIIDIGPTVLDLFGEPTPGFHMGQSLVPLLRGERPRYQRPVAIHDKKGQGAIVFPDLIKAMYLPALGQAEVYDLKKDPKENVNLAGKDWAKERIDTVRRFFAAHEVKASRIWRE
jgi:arylsulfatase A-like enzyme